MTRSKQLLLLTVVSILVGCQAVAPALKALAVAFGQNLIATASANYTPRYALEMEALLVALARETTGLQLQATLAQNGYQAPPPGYAAPNNTAGQSGYPSGGYGQPQGAYQTSTDPYEATSANDAYAEDPYRDSSGEPSDYYDDYASPTDDASGTYNPYARSNDSGASQSRRDSVSVATDNPYATRGIQPIVIEADILAQRAGTNRLEAIDDGAVLRDGGSDPASGDLLKVKFNVNCACYVYVIGVDATGYVAQIYPDAETDGTNPVTPGIDYIVPAGYEDWWAMDAYKGVEQVFFVASYVPRNDIEQVLSRMANQPRNVTAQYQPVNEAAFAASTRGLVRVKKAAASVNTAVGVQPLQSTQFSAEQLTGDVVVTRWFHHE
ncbi:MAG: DUF4384 domain-containing protein [Pseudomonadota bacterium]